MKPKTVAVSLLGLLALVALVGMCVCWITWPALHRIESERLVVQWRSQRVGKMTVVGVVLDSNGAPVAGQGIGIGTGSDEPQDVTDSEGRFRIVLPEASLWAIDVVGVERLRWPISVRTTLFGPDLERGCMLTITTKPSAMAANRVSRTRAISSQRGEGNMTHGAQSSAMGGRRHVCAG